MCVCVGWAEGICNITKSLGTDKYSSGKFVPMFSVGFFFFSSKKVFKLCVCVNGYVYECR